MLRKTMIALCAIASIGILAPDTALAGHGGGGGGGGHGGGGGGFGGGGGGSFAARGGGGGWSGGSFGSAHAAVGTSGFSGRSFGAAPTNSFAHAAPNGGVTTGAVQGNRFASGNRFADRDHGRGFDRDHGFRHNRRFFDGGFLIGDDFGYYPDYAYDDYYDNGGCYIVNRRVHTAYGWRIRPVQVCS